jgi:tetratricopeptide (TPR) repeat protein
MFAFESYPDHPWIAEWTFEPRGCTTSYRENRSNHFFRSLQTVGQIVAHCDEPEWSIQIPVPQNSRINLLGNGFCAYFKHRKIHCGAEVLIPEPGVLWGQYRDIPEPVLLTDLPAERDGDFLWIESGTLNALLCVRNGSFCLVTRDPIRSDAVRTAERYLNQDFEQCLAGELEQRSGACKLFEDMSHHDSLAAISLESMMKALRPAEGRIPHIWSQSSSTETPCFEINELFPLAQAWSLVAPETAEELILCALKIQTNAGALPIHFSPHTTYSVAEAPKPLLAKTTEQVWSVRKDPQFLKATLPLLRRHLQWLLHHFDPKRRGLYSWKNQNEPIIPSLYQSDLVTVDLAVLLLTEINALNRLRRESGDKSMQDPCFEQERIGLEESIEEQFWNDGESAFTNAFVRDDTVPVYGFPQLTPLLWNGIPQMQKAAILEKIRESETLPGQQNALSWRQASMESATFPFLQQFLLLKALKTADPHGTILSDFSRLTIQGFVEWHTMSLKSSNTLQINPATAAFILNVQAMHKYRYYSTGEVSSRITAVLRKFRADRTDVMIITSVLLLIFCVETYYDMRNSAPPFLELETRMSNAYAEKNVDATLKTCIEIMNNYPGEASRARLLAGNILMMTGEYEKAVELYGLVRRDFPDSPGAMISLGLAHQLNGRFEQATENYYEFCYLFDEIFPDVVAEVSEFDFLSREGFKTPPNWKEIYRYQFMHEL